jgi:hypothetical protein
LYYALVNGKLRKVPLCHLDLPVCVKEVTKEVNSVKYVKKGMAGEEMSKSTEDSLFKDGRRQERDQKA